MLKKIIYFLIQFAIFGTIFTGLVSCGDGGQTTNCLFGFIIPTEELRDVK